MAKRSITSMPGVRLRSGKYEASVKVGDGKSAEQSYKRFPLDTPPEEIAAWQIQERIALKRKRPAAGTLSDDVSKFLATMEKGSKRHKDFTNNLRYWTNLYGSKSRRSVTKEDCRGLFDTLHAKGFAASTLNHIRQALISLYNDRDGEDAVCPASKIRKFKEPKPERRAMEPEKLDAAISEIRDGKSKARLALILATGARPCEIERLTPERITLDPNSPYIYFATGKNGDDRIVPLNEQGVAAAKLFIQANAFGKFSSSSLSKTLKLAFVRAQLPADLTPEQRRTETEKALAALRQGKRETGKTRWRLNPYVLRHTCFTELRKAGADLADVQALAGHKSAQTTKRYAPVVNAKLVAAVQRINRAVPAGGTAGGDVEDGKSSDLQPVVQTRLACCDNNVTPSASSPACAPLALSAGEAA